MGRYSLCDDYPIMLENLITKGTEYVAKSGVNALILGISGGVDSTLTAAIAERICNRLGIPLIGVSLPTEHNKATELKNATLAGEAFCDPFSHVFLDKAIGNLAGYMDLYAFAETGEEALRLKMRRGNLIARTRMIYLYNLAHRSHGLVLSTDNYTELMLGFWTLHGDVGDLGLIQSLWKTEVYGLAKYLFTEFLAAGQWEKVEALYQAFSAVPTDGLGITNSDLDQIGAGSYETVDNLLIAFLNGVKVNLEHPVISRHLNSAFKRDNPHNLRREDIVG